MTRRKRLNLVNLLLGDLCKLLKIVKLFTVNNLSGYNGIYIYNGIDRIDNNKGYTIDNIVPCCHICNQAKSSFTLQEFQDWIEKVYQNKQNWKR